MSTDNVAANSGRIVDPVQSYLRMKAERDAAVQRAEEAEADANRRLANLRTTAAERDKARKRAEAAEAAIREALEENRYAGSNLDVARILSAALDTEKGDAS